MASQSPYEGAATTSNVVGFPMTLGSSLMHASRTTRPIGVRKPKRVPNTVKLPKPVKVPKAKVTI